MKNLFLGISLSLVVAGGNSVVSGNSVLAGQQRLNVLDMAKGLIAPRASTWKESTKELTDPFFRSKLTRSPKNTGVPVETRTELSDRDILRKLAPQIEPSGYFVIGGEPVLLVNGKRLKVGDAVTLSFEGRVHQVAISSIESNSFTLRLNQQEMRRELK